MASRVNTKFIWILGIVVVLGFVGVSAVALGFGKTSAAQLITRGDKLAAEGKLREAERQYSKAVNKEQTNIVYLDKWIDTITKLADTNKLAYDDDYKKFTNATRQRAITAKEDVAGQVRYLNMVFSQVRGAGQRTAFEALLRESDAVLAYHEKNPPAELRKFRCAALAGMLAFSDLKPEQTEKMMKDFEAVLAAKPDDAEVNGWLESVYQAQADRLRGGARSDDVKALEQKAADVVNEFAKKFPTNPVGILAKIRRDLTELQKDTLASLPREELLKRSQEFRDAALPQLDIAAAGMKTMGRAMLDTGALGRLRQLEEVLDPASRYKRSMECVEAAIAATPSDAELMLQRADLLENRNDYAAGMDQLAKITELPIRTVSVAGMRQFGIKETANYLRTLWAFRAWQSIPSTEENKEASAKALATARELRKSYAATVAPDSHFLALVDAQLAFVDRDYTRSNQLLAQYNRVAKSRDPDALWLQAQVSISARNLGDARQSLRELLTIKPNALNAVLLLADVETQLQNYSEAESLLKQIANLDPSNENIKGRLAQLAAMRGDVGSQSLDDVTRALAELDALSKKLKDDPTSNKQMLAAIAPKVEQFKWDQRLAFTLAQWQARSGDRDAAMATVKKGLEVTPNSAILKSLNLTLGAKNPFDAELALINADETAELEKCLRRADLYVRFGKMEEANAEFDKAAKLAPDDPRVIEQTFMQAINKQEIDAAKKIMERAVSLDLDKVGGVTFQARLLSAQGKTPEAIALMKQVTDKGGSQPEVWRLLGRMHGSIGNLRDASRCFREALNIRPQDPPAIVDLVSTLMRLRQNDEALQISRQFEKYAGGDPEFLHLLLTLEADVGDRSVAIRRREDLSRVMPGDRRNLLTLGDLYVKDGYPDKAEPIVKLVRQEDDFNAVTLDAMVRWAKGDQAGAKEAFEGWIKTHDEMNSYIGFAGFLFSKKDIDSSIAVLDRARPKQDPKQFQIDKALVELLGQLERWGDVVAPAKRIIDANADSPDQSYRKRLVDALVHTGALDDAEKELKTLGAALPSDLAVMLLEADLAGAKKDPKGQRAALDRAIAKFPSQPLVFVKRGELLLTDTKTAKDAIADFDQALKIKPDFFEALRGRAAAHSMLQETEKAIQDIQQALRYVEDTQLLVSFVGDLVGMKQESKAVEVAQEMLKNRPRDVETRVRLGDIVLRRGGTLTTASEFFKAAFDVDKQEYPAQRYLDTLLDDSPARLAEADRFIVSLGSRVQTSPGFMMALGKLRTAQNKKGEAAQAIIKTFNMLNPDQPSPIMAWMSDLQKINPQKDELDKFLQEAAKQVKSPDWMQFFRANLALDNPAIKDRTAWYRALKQLSENKVNPALQQMSFKSLARAYYNDKLFAEATQTWAASLKAFPNDVEIMNNLAFCLAQDLNKSEEALPLALQAAGMAPNSVEVNDTLGYIYMKLKQYPEAEKVFARILGIAPSRDVMVQYGIHLAEAVFRGGKVDEARSLVEQTESVIRQAPAGELSDQRKIDLEKLKAEIPPK